MTPAYQRYLEIQLRESFDIRGCPLKLVLRSRKQQETKPRTAMAVKAKSKTGKFSPKNE
jgi:hypothetical protein